MTELSYYSPMRYHNHMANQKVLGIVGGGQLGRMLTLAATSLGIKVVVVDPSRNCPAAQAGAEQIRAGLHDEKALRELAKNSDYLTIEVEHVGADVLSKICSRKKPVNPAPDTIALIQDKYEQKVFLASHDLPVAPFEKADDEEQLTDAFEKFNKAVIIKTRRNAYDGRGNHVVRKKADIKAALNKFETNDLYVEKILYFKKELAVIVAKDFYGKIDAYPVVETVHARNICTEVIAPAAVSDRISSQALYLAQHAVKKLEGSGVFAIEMFLLQNDEIVINEIAPRVHNSGHFTMNSCATSQFEQHVRAVCALPLGSTKMLSPAAAMVNILGERNGPTQLNGLDLALSHKDVFVHIYGKSPSKVDRKMGHINAIADNSEAALQQARKARKSLEI